jgi:ABC-type bacteriocin/lantibiotic exporter with double-glycine peptidase domain
MPSVTPLLVTHASARVRPVGALWRLRGYLKPFRTQMIVMFAAALGAVAAEIAIPLLTKSVVDGAIAHGDKRLLIPLALAAVALGAAVGLLNMIRRWIQSGAVADIEKSIRDDMYAHLLAWCSRPCCRSASGSRSATGCSPAGFRTSRATWPR